MSGLQRRGQLARSPIARRRRGPKRRTTSPRCARSWCNKRAEIRDLCITDAEKLTDDLFSVWIRRRDAACTAPPSFTFPCVGQLEAAHFIGRSNKTTRYDPRNVHALCGQHHHVVDQHTGENAKLEWITSRIPITLGQLCADSLRFTDRRIAIEIALDWLAPPDERTTA